MSPFAAVYFSGSRSVSFMPKIEDKYTEVQRETMSQDRLFERIAAAIGLDDCAVISERLQYE
jgi:hypothetical protein